MSKVCTLSVDHSVVRFHYFWTVSSTAQVIFDKQFQYSCFRMFDILSFIHQGTPCIDFFDSQEIGPIFFDSLQWHVSRHWYGAHQGS